MPYLDRLASLAERPQVGFRWGSGWLVATGLLVTAAGLIESRVAADDRPPVNVLFLICDDLNCDLGAYGHPQVKSPNIDRLAARGIRFDNAHCQYPLCGPSRASFMTGLYPDQTLVRRNAIYIREHIPNVRTVPQVFRAAGYFATRIGKIYHYNVPKHIGTSGHDDPYSWNYTINPRGRDKTDEDLIFSLRPGSFGGTLSWLAADGEDHEQTDGIAAVEAVRQLENAARSDQPFYLAVGLFRPHTPYVAPRKYFDMYPLEGISVPGVPPNYFEQLPAPAANSVMRRKDQFNLSHDLARQAIQAYYASITFADAQLGIILDTLDKTGLAENTVVLFTSDHGYHMGEHGHWQKTTLFENATRVPLVMAGPGITAGGVAGGPVEMVDFYPTLCDLCGLETPESVSGRSLLPTLRDPQQATRESAFTQYASGYSLRTERFRFTAWGPDGQDGYELYDHHSDPGELVNLAGHDDYQEPQQHLAMMLAQRIEDAGTPPPGVKQIRTTITRNVPQPND